jgi:hypothetical protein
MHWIDVFLSYVALGLTAVVICAALMSIPTVADFVVAVYEKLERKWNDR